MRVRVLLFGMLKELAGAREETLDLPEGSTVADLLAQYSGRPRMRELLPALAVSLNQEYARPEAPLHDNDEVALLPPVSGGKEQNPQVSSRFASLSVREPGAPASLREPAAPRLVSERIDAQAIVEAIKHRSDGAVAVFEGIVRDESRGRHTLYLDYEAYEPMAARELEKLAEEARRRFDIREAAIVHRLGRLQIGETSVLIAVAAAHRAAALDACHWIIDALKKAVPIWKKEYFADGAVWAAGEPFPPEVRVSRPAQKRRRQRKQVPRGLKSL